jgi:N-acetylglutamate synthase-like GNAT family acetyltransferase
MLLLRSYHDNDLSAIIALIPKDASTQKDVQMAYLAPLLATHYSIVCEVSGEVVGFAIFQCAKGEIISIYAKTNQPTHEIFRAMLFRIEEKAHELQLHDITLHTTSKADIAPLHALGFEQMESYGLLHKSLSSYT